MAKVVTFNGTVTNSYEFHGYIWILKFLEIIHFLTVHFPDEVNAKMCRDLQKICEMTQMSQIRFVRNLQSDQKEIINYYYSYQSVNVLQVMDISTARPFRGDTRRAGSEPSQSGASALDPLDPAARGQTSAALPSKD